MPVITWKRVCIAPYKSGIPVSRCFLIVGDCAKKGKKVSLKERLYSHSLTTYPKFPSGL